MQFIKGNVEFGCLSGETSCFRVSKRNSPFWRGRVPGEDSQGAYPTGAETQQCFLCPEHVAIISYHPVLSWSRLMVCMLLLISFWKVHHFSRTDWLFFLWILIVFVECLLINYLDKDNWVWCPQCWPLNFPRFPKPHQCIKRLEQIPVGVFEKCKFSFPNVFSNRRKISKNPVRFCMQKHEHIVLGD